MLQWYFFFRCTDNSGVEVMAPTGKLSWQNSQYSIVIFFAKSSIQVIKSKFYIKVFFFSFL